MKVGIGWDMHRLAEGRDLIIGGVKVEYTLGLDGHSDADVLTHAVIDALLGAAAIGDIGRVFGIDKPETKGISSITLLKRTAELLKNAGFKVGNVDATVIIQEPKLGELTIEMRKNLAEAIGIGPDRVNVKASTAQKLGDIGQGLAGSSYAVALLEEDV